MIKLKDLPAEELVYGHLACAGCGGMLATRMALKVLGPKTILVIPACCVMAVSCFYPQVPFNVPYLVSSFPGTASAVSGIVAGLKRRGQHDVNVVGIAGDGGTLDIGLQALSGAVERGEKFIYICYDNEAYMNTGIQRSSATPYGARTTTTPVGVKGMFEDRAKKDILGIMAAHGIPYAARASVGYPVDYMEKVLKAMKTDGPAFIHVLAPCPPGWGTDTAETVSLARKAVLTGLWVLEEYQNGQRRVTKKITRRHPVSEYLEKQSRFKHLTSEQIAQIQQTVDNVWSKVAAVSEETGKTSEPNRTEE